MKTIVLEVDDESGSVYQSFSLENKAKFLRDVVLMMRKEVCNARLVKLKKFNDEPGNLEGVNADILLQLLRIDEG